MSRITNLRTIRIAERPNLIWLEVETDEGLIGLGETFRGAQAVEAVIHEQIAPLVLGEDSRQIEGISRKLLTPYLGFHSSSAEVRAASALDIALWDLKGKRHGIPIHEALGGASRLEVRAYNTCAGYAYNSGNAKRREIGGAELSTGPYDDQIAFNRDAGVLAESLLEEGYGAMKIWPFDVFAAATGGHAITLAELKQGLEPFRKIRNAVGDRIEVMVELHSLWGTHAAERICRGLEDYGVFWVEDPINKMDDFKALADLRRRVNVPICGSETLAGAIKFREALEADALDIVMIDLSWCGGLTEGRKIAAVAEAYNKPVAPHDCTGPVALLTGLHLALHAPTAIYQEMVRATLATWYRDLVTELPLIDHGMVKAPTRPGLGTELKPEVRQRADATVRESRFNACEAYKRISTPTLATALYKRGLRQQVIQGVTPLHTLGESMVGEAFTLRYMPAREDRNGLEVFRNREHPQRKAVEDCPPGAVLVMDSRMDPRAASAGGILVTRLMKSGVAGVVTDGGFRDSAEIASLSIPAFHQRPSAPTNLTLHEAIDINVPIGCGDAPVFPGDIIVGDNDGVIVVPAHLAEELAMEGTEMTAFEDFVTEEVREGRSILGLYPATDPDTLVRFAAWRKQNGR
jgi:galactonate dehydratase